MIIHVVKKGDTLSKIGEMYNISYQNIASDNEIPIDQSLVVGSTLVINKNNNKIDSIEVNGYAFPGIDIDILVHALPSLSYLSIFSYHIDYSGNLVNIDDDELIMLAKDYQVIPNMVITNIGIEERFDSDLAHYILNNNEIQDILINNILNTMKRKEYLGLDVDFEYVYPEDRNAYMNFLNKISQVIKVNNYILSVAVAPKTSDEQVGLLYEAHDYEIIGTLADHVIIMTYEWGYSGGPARAVSPLPLVEKVINYAVSRIPSSKILMGIPNYGYDWTLPYTPGSLAKSINNYDAVNLARDNNQAISYDEIEESPYLHYYANQNSHEVWFEDARSILAKLELVSKYNLGGVSYWTIDRFFPQNYLVLNNLYNIKKLLHS